MNETRHNPMHGGAHNSIRNARIRPGAVAAVLVAVSLWLLTGGCADPRTEPTAPPDPGFTETIVLWENVVSAGQTIHASFNVDAALAPIISPGEDTPARLTIVAYIRPDEQILRRETIVNSLLPVKSDSIIGLLVGINTAEDTLDWLRYIDSLCSVDPNCGFDTTGLGARIAAAEAELSGLLARQAGLVADTTLLGLERDSLRIVLDNRYTLALWMDDDTTTRYPDATFIDINHTLGGQSIFAAATDQATGFKARGFRLALDRFLAADPNPANVNESVEVNWTTCFIGSPRPCMRPGAHTLHARLTGADSRITATLVLVYAEERP